MPSIAIVGSAGVFDEDIQQALKVAGITVHSVIDPEILVSNCSGGSTTPPYPPPQPPVYTSPTPVVASQEPVRPPRTVRDPLAARNPSVRGNGGPRGISHARPSIPLLTPINPGANQSAESVPELPRRFNHGGPLSNLTLTPLRPVPVRRETPYPDTFYPVPDTPTTPTPPPLPLVPEGLRPIDSTDNEGSDKSAARLSNGNWEYLTPAPKEPKYVLNPNLKHPTYKHAYIPSSVPLHLQHCLTMYFLQAGVQVLKESPLCVSSAQAKEIFDATLKARVESRGHGVRLMVSPTRTYMGKYNWIKKMLPRVGAISDVRVVERARYEPGVKPRIQRGGGSGNQNPALTGTGGGVLLDIGYSMLHQLIYLFGYPTSVIDPTLLKFSSDNGPTQHWYTTAQMMLMFQNQVSAEVTLSRILPFSSHEPLESIEIIGSKGILTLLNDTVSFKDLDEDDSATPTASPIPTKGKNQTAINVKDITWWKHACGDTETPVDLLVHAFETFVHEERKDHWVGDLKIHADVMRLIDEIYTIAAQG